jgi:glycine cleavage system H protein
MTVLFFIATILVFLTIDVLYRRVKERKALPATAPSAVRGYPLRTPEGVFFTKSHSWLNLFPSGKVQMGVDDFVGTMLDKPEVGYLKKTGDTIRKGEPVLVLRQNDHRLTICSPIEGEVLATNQNLEHHPEYLRTSLFSDGWAYQIKPARLSDLKTFLLGPETGRWMRQELGRLRDFLSGACGQAAFALQDGGMPQPGALAAMDAEDWQEFEREFLTVTEEGNA